MIRDRRCWFALAPLAVLALIVLGVVGWRLARPPSPSPPPVTVKGDVYSSGFHDGVKQTQENWFGDTRRPEEGGPRRMPHADD